MKSTVYQIYSPIHFQIKRKKKKSFPIFCRIIMFDSHDTTNYSFCISFFFILNARLILPFVCISIICQIWFYFLFLYNALISWSNQTWNWIFLRFLLYSNNLRLKQIITLYFYFILIFELFVKLQFYIRNQDW